MSIAIKAEGLSKYYRLGVINHGMLYKDMQSWMAKKFGRPDPHAQIGANHFADQADGFWALKDLDFEIQQGDRIGIIGKNGAGKSTLLKVLSRITAPTEGVVKIRGRVASLLEVGTGFHGELTGRENIYLNGAILGMKKNEITERLDEIIDFSEIDQYIDTPVKRYSSGMYVRLAFAVAAHLHSDILIADEVLAVGDANFQNKAIGKMSELSSGQGKTVLFVSHNMAAVKQLCNKGMVLEKGRNRPIQTIAEAIHYYGGGITKGQKIDISNFKRKKECTLKAKITDFSIITIDGENTGTFDSEQQIKIKLKVESFIDGLETGMQIFVSHYWQNICMFDSGHLKNTLFKLNKGRYELECNIDRISLFAGLYNISIGLSVPGKELIDFIPNVFAIEMLHYDPANAGFNMHIDNGLAVFNPDHSYSCRKII